MLLRSQSSPKLSSGMESCRNVIGLSRKGDRWRPKASGREGRGGNVGRKRTTRRKKETVVASTARGREIRRERKRKIYGATRCRLTTGSVRLPTKPLLHAISSTIFTRVLPFTLRSLERPPSSSLWLLRSLVRLFACSRCTVAFGLCIIITVTASSSWLVEESPCLCSFCHYPVDVVFSHRIGHSRETDTSAHSTRVYALIQFPRDTHAILCS